MARRFLAIALVAVACFGIGRWTVKNANAAEDFKSELMKAEAARDAALPNGDVEALRKQYDADLVYTNAKGQTLTKTEHLAEITARKLSFVSYKHDDVTYHVYGTTGIVLGTSHSVVVNNGVTSTNFRKFVNVYSRMNGQWLCVGHTETPIVD
jgi:hypothetical protein